VIGLPHHPYVRAASRRGCRAVSPPRPDLRRRQLTMNCSAAVAVGASILEAAGFAVSCSGGVCPWRIRSGCLFRRVSPPCVKAQRRSLYHRRRRQDALGGMTPIEFETLTQAAHAACPSLPIRVNWRLGGPRHLEPVPSIVVTPGRHARRHRHRSGPTSSARHGVAGNGIDPVAARADCQAMEAMRAGVAITCNLRPDRDHAHVPGDVDCPREHWCRAGSDGRAGLGRVLARLLRPVSGAWQPVPGRRGGKSKIPARLNPRV
jgi:hypothetical protein